MGVLKAKDVEAALRRGGPCDVDEDVAARFAAGEAVVVRNLNPAGHTRAPRYVRGKRGEIARDHGVFIFPDAHAMGRGKAPQHLYNVRFESVDVWGADSPARDAIYIDLWDSYLEPA